MKLAHISHQFGRPVRSCSDNFSLHSITSRLTHACENIETFNLFFGRGWQQAVRGDVAKETLMPTLNLRVTSFKRRDWTATRARDHKGATHWSFQRLQPVLATHTSVNSRGSDGRNSNLTQHVTGCTTFYNVTNSKWDVFNHHCINEANSKMSILYVGRGLYISTTNSLKQNVKYFSWALKQYCLIMNDLLYLKHDMRGTETERWLPVR